MIFKLLLEEGGPDESLSKNKKQIKKINDQKELTFKVFISTDEKEDILNNTANCWNGIEQIGREKFSLSQQWFLRSVIARNPKKLVMQFQKKGPRGGWLRGKENKFDGLLKL